MSEFILKEHRVKKALFKEHHDKQKSNNLEVGLEGNTLIPKDTEKNRKVIVQLKLALGGEEAHLFLELETISVFEAEDMSVDINEDSVEKNCLPIAFASLRKSVKNVTEAYGLPPLELPPFEGEI